MATKNTAIGHIEYSTWSPDNTPLLNASVFVM
jgi:hypothetical protein